MSVVCKEPNSFISLDPIQCDWPIKTKLAPLHQHLAAFLCILNASIKIDDRRDSAAGG